MTHGCPRLKPSCLCTANAQRRWTQHVSLNMGARLSETLQSHSIVFLYLFMSFSLHFSSLLNLFPCEGSVFFLSFGLTFFGTCLEDSVGAHLTGTREGVRDLKSLVMVTGRSQDSQLARLPRLALHMAAYSKLFESRQWRERLKMNTHAISCNHMNTKIQRLPALIFCHLTIKSESESVRRRHCNGVPTQAPAEQESKDSLVVSAWLCPRQLEAGLFVIEFCTTLLDLFEKEGNGSIAIWLKITLRLTCPDFAESSILEPQEMVEGVFGCQFWLRSLPCGKACRSQSSLLMATSCKW